MSVHLKLGISILVYFFGEVNNAYI